VMQWMRPRAYPALSTAYANAASMKLALNPEASQNPARVGVEGLAGDSLTFSNVLRRWGIAGTFTITSATTVGGLLATIPVTPFVCASGGSPPPIAVAALTHAQWSGSVEYRFIISSCRFVRGRFALFFVPNTTPPTSPITLDVLVASDVLYFDLNSSHDIEVVVPWAQITPWTSHHLLSAANQRVFSSITSTGRGCNNGWLCMAVVENLSANTAITPTLTCTVLIRAGEDFAVADPSLVLGRNFYAVSGERKSDSVFGGPDMTRVRHKFAGPSWSAELLAAAGGGEAQGSFRPLLKRPTFSETFVSTNVAGAANNTAYTAPLHSIVKYPLNTATSGVNFMVTPASILAACFSLFRGTERHTACFHTGIGGTGVATSVQMVVGRQNQYGNGIYDNATHFVQNAPVGDLLRPLPLDGGADMMTIAGGNIFGPITVDVPYNDVNWTWVVPVRTGTRVSGRATLINYDGAALGLSLFNLYAIGEDFQFYGWTGLPALSNQTTIGNTYPAGYATW